MAMKQWMPKVVRNEAVSKACSRIGEPGALADEWNSEAPNCLQFVAWVYGYNLGNMSDRIGEIADLWPQVRAYTGWNLRPAGEDPLPGDLLGLKFRYQWHVGVYIGDNQFVHVMGRRIRKSRLKYWRREGVQVLAMPDMEEVK